MNAAQVGEWFRANRTAVLAVGGAGVVGAGLLARRRSGGGDVTPASGSSSSSSAGAPGFSAGAQVAGVAGTYDSSASDLYSAMAPEFAGIAQTLAELQGKIDAPTPVPAAPAPAPAAAPPAYVSPAAGIKAGFYKQAGTPNVYKVSGGKIDYLTPKEFAAMTKGQNVKLGSLSKDNPVFGNGAHWLDARKQTVKK